MNKLVLVVLVFLIFGAVMIKYDAELNGGDFQLNLWAWLKQLFYNVKGLTGYAVDNYEWLPNTSLNMSDPTGR